MQGKVHALLSSFAGPPKPLYDWPAAILELVTTVYGDEPLDDTIAADRAVIRACDAILEVLKQHRQVPRIARAGRQRRGGAAVGVEPDRGRIDSAAGRCGGH